MDLKKQSPREGNKTNAEKQDSRGGQTKQTQNQPGRAMSQETYWCAEETYKPSPTRKGDPPAVIHLSSS